MWSRCLSHALRDDQTTKGPKPTKIVMLRGIVDWELKEHNTKLLCSLGLIPPLQEMAFTHLESKELSVSLLLMLSTNSENKTLFIASGAVPLLVIGQHNVFLPLLVLILEKCTQMLEKLTSSGDGIKFFAEDNDTYINLESLVKNLLAFLQNSRLIYSISGPLLHVLFKICEQTPDW
ncbi:hypothetical protein L1887_32786 [Cichorium endivia]|nr:hypothetical protein L1887_32786 [Cichorium endivia]